MEAAAIVLVLAVANMVNVKSLVTVVSSVTLVSIVSLILLVILMTVVSMEGYLWQSWSLEAGAVIWWWQWRDLGSGHHSAGHYQGQAVLQ